MRSNGQIRVVVFAFDSAESKVQIVLAPRLMQDFVLMYYVADGVNIA